jgi:hypothetical protein
MFFKTKVSKRVVTNQELSNLIARIFEEEENRAKFNGVEFGGLSEEQIMNKIGDRIGYDWEPEK